MIEFINLLDPERRIPRDHPLRATLIDLWEPAIARAIERASIGDVVVDMTDVANGFHVERLVKDGETTCKHELVGGRGVWMKTGGELIARSAAALLMTVDLKFTRSMGPVPDVALDRSALAFLVKNHYARVSTTNTLVAALMHIVADGATPSCEPLEVMLGKRRRCNVVIDHMTHRWHISGARAENRFGAVPDEVIDKLCELDSAVLPRHTREVMAAVRDQLTPVFPGG